MAVDRTAALKTNQAERTKSFMVYDGSGRMTDVYEAHAEAVTGTPCLRTQYSYDGVSGRVLKRLETNSTWDASYDI